MKIAAAKAIAFLAKGDVPDVVAAYGGIDPSMKNYIIPSTFDPDCKRIPAAVELQSNRVARKKLVI